MVKIQHRVIFCILLLAVGLPLANADTPKEEVVAAATALGGQPNYSWENDTVSISGGGRFTVVNQGKTEKGACTWVDLIRGNVANEAFLEGNKCIVQSFDMGWVSLDELAKEPAEINGAPNPNQYLIRNLTNYKLPDAIASDLVTKADSLKKEGDALGGSLMQGNLTEDGAKALLLTGRSGSTTGLVISAAKGYLKFWLNNGLLMKFEFHVTGTISFNGSSRDIDRTTTVVIRDVSNTKINIPGDIKAKL